MCECKNKSADAEVLDKDDMGGGQVPVKIHRKPPAMDQEAHVGPAPKKDWDNFQASHKSLESRIESFIKSKKDEEEAKKAAKFALMDKSLTEMLIKAGNAQWVPFAGERGGFGVKNPLTGEREYGHNAERRLRVANSPPKSGQQPMDLHEVARQILDGRIQIGAMEPSQLLSMYNFTRSIIDSGETDQSYKRLLDELQQEVERRGLQRSVPKT